jgi:hypothetical protein
MFAGDSLLDFETIEVWQTNVENEAARAPCARPLEELLRRGERLRTPAGVIYETPYSLTDLHIDYHFLNDR